MKSVVRPSIIATLLALASGSRVVADIQVIPPGKGLQSAVVIDSGANGVCETTVPLGTDDVQVITAGKGLANQAEIRCGTNMTADTTAAGDDVQLVAVSAGCANANTPVIDTGADGVANTTAAVDDSTVLAPGAGQANATCVTVGGNGIASTTAAGDDVQIQAAGTAKATTAVIRCGPNKVVETTANNVAAGDDVQVLAVNAACGNKNTIVVNSGPNGIAETRAQGPDFSVGVLYPVRLFMTKGKPSVSRTVRVAVSNIEFGASAPATRDYSLAVTDGSCPAGTVTQVDSNAGSLVPGLQATATVPRGGRVYGSFTVKFPVEAVLSVTATTPFRCSVDVEADAVDTAAFNAVDDGADTANNTMAVDIEVVDRNDLP
ncbi:MAG: hypothetical protein HYR72_19400 [Deltaproteobacteria bacterium]|nr:hypothetical protein [Deltaproteobacteria bacterium]MBI3391229.1 hypothetical protein [Deltaproteobacteria bacterium]